jgi:hypothetical protein
MERQHVHVLDVAEVGCEAGEVLDVLWVVCQAGQ